MTNENCDEPMSEPTSGVPTLSIPDDDVRPLRDRVHAARRHLEIAMQFTMWSEVRVEMRAAHAELMKVLADIDG
jgi:hypothetical protein